MELGDVGVGDVRGHLGDVAFVQVPADSLDVRQAAALLVKTRIKVKAGWRRPRVRVNVGNKECCGWAVR